MRAMLKSAQSLFSIGENVLYNKNYNSCAQKVFASQFLQLILKAIGMTIWIPSVDCS
jgi:hypothetical protein